MGFQVKRGTLVVSSCLLDFMVWRALRCLHLLFHLPFCGCLVLLYAFGQSRCWMFPMESLSRFPHTGWSASPGPFYYGIPVFLASELCEIQSGRLALSPLRVGFPVSPIFLFFVNVCFSPRNCRMDDGGPRNGTKLIKFLSPFDGHPSHVVWCDESVMFVGVQCGKTCCFVRQPEPQIRAS